MLKLSLSPPAGIESGHTSGGDRHVLREKIDTAEFRQALGCFATGVTVVTAVAEDGTHVGLTVNSFNSLSLEPPLVLWSLGGESPLMAAFAKASHFTINVLAEEQGAVSGRFARR